MKRDSSFSAVIGVVLVFAIALIFINCCRLLYNNPSDDPKWEYEDEYEEEYGEETEEKMLAQKGYRAYAALSEPLKKLMDSGVFAPTEQTADRYIRMYGEEKGGRDGTVKMLQEEYERRKDELAQIGGDEYLNSCSDIDALPEEEPLSGCCLKWDQKSGTFADQDTIAAIENCGFTGFSELVKDVEMRYRDYRKGDGHYWSGNGYTVYCRGVAFCFELPEDYETEYLELTFRVSAASYYAPEKYRNLIQGIAEGDSGYFPYYCYTEGKKNVLVLCRDYSVYDDTGSYMRGGQSPLDNKRIVLIYEGGQLVDYYVTAATEILQLDDTDRKFLDQYTSGSGRKLSERGETGNYNTTAKVFRSY